MGLPRNPVAHVDTAPRTKGLNATRGMLALAAAKGFREGIDARLDTRWGPATAGAIKAAVSASSVGDWAPEDGSPATMELIEAAVGAGALGQLGARRLPFRRPAVMIAGAEAGWAAEAGPIRVQPAAFTPGMLTPHKLGAILVTTNAVLEAVGSLAERAIATDFERALSLELDAAAFDPLNAGTPGVKPASLLHGAPGSDVADNEHLRVALLAGFTGRLEAAVVAMNPATALALYAFEHPDIGPRGGSLFNIPAVTGAGIPEGIVALIDPHFVAVGIDGGGLISNHEGTVEMNDAPSPGAGQRVSLWQTGSTAFGSFSWVDWQRVQPGSVTWVRLPGAAS